MRGSSKTAGRPGRHIGAWIGRLSISVRLLLVAVVGLKATSGH